MLEAGNRHFLIVQALVNKTICAAGLFHRSRVTGRGSQFTGHRSRVTGRGSQVAGHRSRVTGRGSQVAGHRSRVTGHGSRVTGRGSQIYELRQHPLCGVYRYNRVYLWYI
jgi:hypothetical protein